MGASESKLAFKQTIFSLASREDIPFADELWPEFITLPESAEDVFTLWSPHDIGCLTLSNKDNSPPPNTQVEPKKNLQTLIYIIVTRLQTLQYEPVDAEGQAAVNLQVLNCMRILTRVMPFIHEAKHLEQWYDTFFWQYRRPTCFMDKETGEPGQFFDALHIEKKYGMEDFDTQIDGPLGEALLSILVRYLFWPGFTVPRRVKPDGTQDLDFVVKVWQTGIGSNKVTGCTKENEKNQAETLRLCLALMSRPLYIGPNEVALTMIKPLNFITSCLENRATINGILCSLLNTVMKYNPNMWSVPLDMATGNNDSKRELVTRCLQFLLVLMAYGETDPLYQNHFRMSLSKLHRAEDLQFIHQGMTQVLGQPVSTSFNYAIGRDKALPWAPEMIAFLWELLECNHRFRRYLVQTHGGLDYVVLVLYYALDAKDDPTKTGVLQMCCYFLQTMTAQPEFAEQLNGILRGSETLPMLMRIPHFHGSYGDFLICSIHTVFTTTKRRMEFLYPALVEIIRNIAPKQRNLARATSVKLTDLYGRLMRSEFLLLNDFNPAMLKSLLDAMAALVESHPSDNRRLVEVLVANRSAFKALKDFTIDGALAERDRQAQERKDRGEGAGTRSSSQNSSFDSARDRPTARRPSLNDVNEDERFAIGDDDDGEDDGDDQPLRGSSANNAASRTEGAVESDQQSLSEKARGKQRVSTTTTNIPSGSRNNSIHALQTQTSTHPQSQTQFEPTREWFEAWHSQLPLDSILRTIHLAETRQLKYNATPLRTPAAPNGPALRSTAPPITPAERPTPAATPHADLPSTPAAIQSQQQGRDAARSAQLARQPQQEQEEDSRGPDDQSHLQTDRALDPRPFTWTPLAIGWYTALIWSRIYLTEAEAFQGASGLYSSTNVVLFKRAGVGKEISLRSPRGAIDAVGESLAERIRSVGMK